LRETILTESEKFAGSTPPQANAAQDAMPFFGIHIVSFERGVVRQSPQGLFVYTEDGREEIALPPYMGHAAELIELRDALIEGRDVFPNGQWGRKNLRTCLAILQSAREEREIAF
jgi:phthalate 4,5-cis-dihydrodiol dehydrogenase